MKFLSLILALFITLLTFSSGFVQEECRDDISGTEQSQKNPKHDDCNNCCPFMCCHICCSFIISLKTAFIITEEVRHRYARVFSFYKSFITSEFSTPVWQPPKMA